MLADIWMKREDFDDLCAEMKKFEQFGELAVLPCSYIIVRVDGSNFHEFTERMSYEKPFDRTFSDIMVGVASDIMTKYNAIFAYTQSDEISFLLADPNFFNRRVEKIDSIIASETASRFTMDCKEPVAFDGRIITLPDNELIFKYFRWRMEDANRNALNLWAYWTLRKKGKSAHQAGSMLKNAGVAVKNEVLFQNGINYATDVEAWTKRGIALRWDYYLKESFNPITKEKVKVWRKRMKMIRELPIQSIKQRALITDVIEDNEYHRSLKQ